jgi:hypothetical protein
MTPFSQDSAPGFIEKAWGGAMDIKNTVVDFKDGVGDAIKAIGKLAEIIINGIDWVITMIANPVIILTFVDKMSIIIIMVLIILKMLGFDNLEKWIWLSIIIKILVCVFL